MKRKKKDLLSQALLIIGTIMWGSAAVVDYTQSNMTGAIVNGIFAVVFAVIFIVVYNKQKHLD